MPYVVLNNENTVGGLSVACAHDAEKHVWVDDALFELLHSNPRLWSRYALSDNGRNLIESTPIQVQDGLYQWPVLSRTEYEKISNGSRSHLCAIISPRRIRFEGSNQVQAQINQGSLVLTVHAVDRYTPLMHFRTLRAVRLVEYEFIDKHVPQLGIMGPKLNINIGVLYEQ